MHISETIARVCFLMLKNSHKNMHILLATTRKKIYQLTDCSSKTIKQFQNSNTLKDSSYTACQFSLPELNKHYKTITLYKWEYKTTKDTVGSWIHTLTHPESSPEAMVASVKLIILLTGVLHHIYNKNFSNFFSPAQPDNNFMSKRKLFT